VIARAHRGGRIPLLHVDAYRLGSLAEVDDMDLDVAIEDSVTVVEWGAGLVEQLTEARLEVSIERAPESEVRSVRLTPVGDEWASRIAALT
jgi:tRNA threonylcarbamoyladenosine biosynthesis protein TsaE